MNLYVRTCRTHCNISVSTELFKIIHPISNNCIFEFIKHRIVIYQKRPRDKLSKFRLFFCYKYSSVFESLDEQRRISFILESESTI